MSGLLLLVVAATSSLAASGTPTDEAQPPTTLQKMRIEISALVRMPLWAVRLRSVSSRQGVPPHQVLARGYRFQMSGVTADAIAAEMIDFDFVPWRENDAMGDHVGDAMSASPFQAAGAGDKRDAVPVLVAC